MRAMMAIEDAGTRYPQQFRRVCSAGEPLNPEAIRWFREQYGVTVLDYYGLTESYPLVGNYPFMEVREGSMGKPMPGWDVAILDEDERPVAQGERGEICLRARTNPHYPLGYWNRPEDTEEVFGGEWFHTKDAAREDEDGYVWYEGRADDVIIAAGYRDRPLRGRVRMPRAPGRARGGGRRLARRAARQRRQGVHRACGDHEPSDELADEIKAFVRERLSAYAYPRRIEFVDDLPKTLTGKSGASSSGSWSSNEPAPCAAERTSAGWAPAPERPKRANLSFRAVPFHSQWRSLPLRELERGGCSAAKLARPLPHQVLPLAVVFESRQASRPRKSSFNLRRALGGRTGRRQPKSHPAPRRPTDPRPARGRTGRGSPWPVRSRK